MRIPAHQVHNVLNAYARRLKKNYDAQRGIIADTDEDPGISYSAETKRRAIIDKLSTDILLDITRFSPAPRTVPETRDDRKTDPAPEPEEIRYNMINKNGEKISAVMKIQDSDFLIRNLGGSDETTDER